MPLLAVNAAWSLHMAVHEKAVLDSGLRFDQSDPSGMERADFNNAAWAMASIPHSRGLEQAQCGKRYLREPGWYRRAFSAFCFKITADLSASGINILTMSVLSLFLQGILAVGKIIVRYRLSLHDTVNWLIGRVHSSSTNQQWPLCIHL